ncbi:hypothetical protein F5Y16DRAFT_401752 [Xylariaceae sp. FL0255]|nr:hypothetical protein F5Y16DRAFT_401752 [Xylariaceae sp. FL0255]
MQIKKLALLSPLMLALASALPVEDKRAPAGLEKDNDDIWLWKKSQLEKDNDDIWLWKKASLEERAKLEKDNDDIWLWKKDETKSKKLQKDNDDIWLW